MNSASSMHLNSYGQQKAELIAAIIPSSTGKMEIEKNTIMELHVHVGLTWASNFDCPKENYPLIQMNNQKMTLSSVIGKIKLHFKIVNWNKSRGRCKEGCFLLWNGGKETEGSHISSNIQGGTWLARYCPKQGYRKLYCLKNYTSDLKFDTGMSQ